MPTYLVHGFRWHRPAIRIHIILYDLDDAAAEWIMAPATSLAFLNSFYTLYDFLPPMPERPPPIPSPILNNNAFSKVDMRHETNGNASPIRVKKSWFGGRGSGTSRPSTGTDASRRTTSVDTMEAVPPKKKEPAFNTWSTVKLLEQYDPEDLTVSSQPYAYVADHIIDVKLSADIAGEMKDYEDRIKKERKSHTPKQSNGTNGSATEAAPEVEAGVAAPSAALGETKVPDTNETKEEEAHWIDKLREKLQKDEKMGWYVVTCGDEERYVEQDSQSMRISVDEAYEASFNGEEYDETANVVDPPRYNAYNIPLPPMPPSESQPVLQRPKTSGSTKDGGRPKTPKLKSMRSFFGRKEKEREAWATSDEH